MSERRRSLWRWLGVVVAVLAALVAFDVWWAVHYRHDQPLTIDEAGYLAIGLIDHIGLQGGGLHAWWNAISDQVPQAPLVPAVTSLAFGLNEGVLAGFVVLTGFAVVLALAVFGIGERLGGPRLGALAAIVVATAPGTFAFSREYVFAIAVAAFLALAVMSLLRSDAMRDWRWALACGAALGLMVLSRSMTVAFVPAVVLAALVAIAVRGRFARREGEPGVAPRLLNLGLALLLGAGLAATWYVRNFTPVYDYLTGFGYGDSAVYYGSDASWLSWDRWNRVASKMTFVDLLLPLAALIAVGLVVLAVVAAQRLRAAPDRRAAALALLGGDVFSVCLVFACCYLALTSTRNAGEGFTFPVAMLLVPVAVLALRYLKRPALYAALGVLALVTALNLASATDLSEGLSKRHLVDLPAFEPLPWISGTPQAVSAIREEVPGPAATFTEAEKGWKRATDELATVVQEAALSGAAHEPVAFASRNVALNTSSLYLEGLLDYHRGFAMDQVNAEPDDSVANYVHQLTSPEFPLPGILVTMSDETGDYAPIVTQAKAEAAARRTGFHLVRRIPLPDGRQMRVWFKRETG